MILDAYHIDLCIVQQQAGLLSGPVPAPPLRAEGRQSADRRGMGRQGSRRQGCAGASRQAQEDPGRGQVAAGEL